MQNESLLFSEVCKLEEESDINRHNWVNKLQIELCNEKRGKKG